MRKIFLATLIILIFFAQIVFAEESANEKLLQIERDTYGNEQIGAILDRLNKLEKDFTGSVRNCNVFNLYHRHGSDCQNI